MTRSARSPDAVDSHIALRERVRKLEIAHSSKTITPWRWIPDKRQLHAIAEHSMLMGFGWFSDNDANSIDLVPGAAAQALRDQEIAEGVYGTALAKQFMRFRQCIGVYPPQRYFYEGHSNNWQVSGVGTAGLLPPAYSYSDGWNNPKLFHMVGPADAGGRWHILPGGWDQIYAVGPYSDPVPVIPTGTVWPQYNGAPPVGGGYLGPDPDHFPFQGVCSGSYVYFDSELSAIFWTGVRDSRWGAGGMNDCGDPLFYHLVPDVTGTRHTFYQRENFDCPASPGGAGANYGTGGEMCYITVPADSFYFDRPPVPWRGQVSVSVTNQPFMLGAGPGGGLGYLRQAIARAFNSGHFPLVQRWYDQRLPVGELRTTKNWLRARVVPPWVGNVHVRVMGQKVTMRGSLHLDVDPRIAWTTGCAVVLPPEIRLYRNEATFVLTRAVLNDGSEVVTGLLVRDLHSSGRLGLYPAGYALYPHIGDGSNMPATLHFDGATFNCRPIVDETD